MSNRLRNLHHILRKTHQSDRKLTMTSAGLILIGDEILKGQIQDTNMHFLAKNLYSIGIPLSKVSVISDDIDVISEELRRFHKDYTYVFTSGGIGSTHDDVTFEAVAQAFSEKAVYNPELKELVWNYFKLDSKDEDTIEATLKLAKIPESAVLSYGKDPKTGEPSPYPVVSLKNVFIFPGIPSLFERAFNIIKDSLHVKGGKAQQSQNVYLNVNETSFTPQLNRLVSQFKGTVTFGSYPQFYNSYYKVRISVESTDLPSLQSAVDAVKDAAGMDNVVDFEPDPIRNAALRVYDLAAIDSPLGAKVKKALTVVEEAFQKYEHSEVCIGFNGGKDCTALLHLVFAVHSRQNLRDSETSHPRLQGLYIRSRWPFPEVEQFIEKSVKDYGIEMIRLNGQIKACLSELRETQPTVQAVFMGSRFTDPRCENLSAFAMTDPSWPQFMRINPILDWTYADVWAFLRSLNVPYCSLYDRGYTSLGSMENTHPNPALRRVGSTGIVEYLPAFDLENSDSERSGRG